MDWDSARESKTWLEDSRKFHHPVAWKLVLVMVLVFLVVLGAVAAYLSLQEIPGNIHSKPVELPNYKQITAGDEKRCILSSQISGKPRQCRDKTGSAALTCCSEACNADGTCDGLWWQPLNNSNCILYRNCSKQENTSFPGSIYRKLAEQWNYKPITDGEMKRCVLSTKMCITNTFDKQCVPSEPISRQPHQCEDKTGSAALACCFTSCSAELLCTAVWWQPQINSTCTFLESGWTIDGSIGSRCSKQENASFPGSMYRKLLFDTWLITDDDNKRCVLSSYISGKPPQCLDRTGSAALTCCSETCLADQTCGGFVWQPESNFNCILFGDCRTLENAAFFRGSIYRVEHGG